MHENGVNRERDSSDSWMSPTLLSPAHPELRIAQFIAEAAVGNSGSRAALFRYFRKVSFAQLISIHSRLSRTSGDVADTKGVDSRSTRHAWMATGPFALGVLVPLIWRARDERFGRTLDAHRQRNYAVSIPVLLPNLRV